MRSWTYIAGCAIILFAVLAAPERSWAGGVLIGPFWIEGVTTHEYPEDFIDVDDGRWVRVDYEVESGPESSPRIIIFDKPIKLDGLPTTERVRQEAVRLGAKVVLEGLLRGLYIRAYILKSNIGRQLWIEPWHMAAELGRVTSGLQDIAGGSMDLAGSRLWINNPTVFRTRGDALDGVFELETWNRKLVNALLAFPTGTSGRGTFAPIVGIDNTNIKLRVDMRTAIATLWDASLQATEIKLTGPSLEIGNVTLLNPDVKAKRVSLGARKGQLYAKLADVSGVAKNMERGGGQFSFTAEAPEVRWGRGNARGHHDTASAMFGELEIADGYLRTAKAEMATAGGPLVSGPVTVTDIAVRGNSMRGQFKWEKPLCQWSSFAVPDGAVKNLQFKVSGPLDGVPALAGSMDVSSFQVGGVRIHRDMQLALPATNVAPEIRVPIVVDVANVGGAVEIVQPDATILLTAELTRLLLRASLVLLPEEPLASWLEVDADNFQLQAQAAVASTPWFGSTRPMFAKAAIKARNHSLLRVARAGASGLITIDTAGMIVTDPVIQLGEGGKQFRAKTNISSDGAVSFAYCLDRGDIVIIKGRLTADVLEFESQDPNAVVDVGGVLVTHPKGSVSNLVMTVDRVANTATMNSGKIEMGGATVARVRAADAPTDVQFRGAISENLTIAGIDGTPDFTATRIVLNRLDARNVAVAIREASVDIGQLISLNEASVIFRANRVTSTKEEKNSDSDTPVPVKPKFLGLKKLEDVCLPILRDDQDPDLKQREYFETGYVEFAGRLRLDGALDGGVTVHLANNPQISNASITASGRTDRLTGQGSAQFSGFVGGLTSGIETKANCEGGKLLRIPIATDIATAGGSLTVALNRGKGSFRGSLAGFGLAIRTTGQTECSSDWRKEVLVEAKSGWTEGICPTWKEPLRRCRWTWDTPEVSYEYRTKAVIRALAAAITMTNPYIEMGEKKVGICNLGAAAVGPMKIIGGYYPEFRGNIPVVSQVANVFVGATAEAVESTIANTIGDKLGGFAGNLLNLHAGADLCILTGAWR